MLQTCSAVERIEQRIDTSPTIDGHGAGQARDVGPDDELIVAALAPQVIVAAEPPVEQVVTRVAAQIVVVFRATHILHGCQGERAAEGIGSGPGGQVDDGTVRRRGRRADLRIESERV